MQTQHLRIDITMSHACTRKYSTKQIDIGTLSPPIVVIITHTNLA